MCVSGGLGRAAKTGWTREPRPGGDSAGRGRPREPPLGADDKSRGRPGEQHTGPTRRRHGADTHRHSVDTATPNPAPEQAPGPRALAEQGLGKAAGGASSGLRCELTHRGQAWPAAAEHKEGPGDNPRGVWWPSGRGGRDRGTPRPLGVSGGRAPRPAGPRREPAQGQRTSPEAPPAQGVGQGSHSRAPAPTGRAGGPLKPHSRLPPS